MPLWCCSVYFFMVFFIFFDYFKNLFGVSYYLWLEPNFFTKIPQSNSDSCPLPVVDILFSQSLLNLSPTFRPLPGLHGVRKQPDQAPTTLHPTPPSPTLTVAQPVTDSHRRPLPLPSSRHCHHDFSANSCRRLPHRCHGHIELTKLVPTIPPPPPSLRPTVAAVSLETTRNSWKRSEFAENQWIFAKFLPPNPIEARALLVLSLNL